MVNPTELRIGNWVVDANDDAYQIKSEADIASVDKFQPLPLSIVVLDGVKDLPGDTSAIRFLHQYQNYYYDMTGEELDLS